jgi:hypothetical protein
MMVLCAVEFGERWFENIESRQEVDLSIAKKGPSDINNRKIPKHFLINLFGCKWFSILFLSQIQL